MSIHLETRAVIPVGCTIAEIRAVLDGFDGSARLIDVVLADDEHRRVALPDLVDVVLVVAAPGRSAGEAQPQTDDHPPAFVDGWTDDLGPDGRTVRTDDHGRCSANGSALAEHAAQYAATGAVFAPHSATRSASDSACAAETTPHSPADTTPQAAPVDISDLIPEAEKIADGWDGPRNPSSRALGSALRTAGFRFSQEKLIAVTAHVAARAETAQRGRSGTPHSSVRTVPQPLPAHAVGV